MKKIILPILAVAIAIGLTGCTTKSATTTTTDTASATASGNQTPAAFAQQDQTNQAQVQALETVFEKNLTSATADANSLLGNQAKFCSAQVELAAKGTFDLAKQTFYFVSTSSDAKYNQWYVASQFDLTTKKRSRLFVARTDLTDSVKCSDVKFPGGVSYVSAYESFVSNDSTNSTSSDTLSKVIISLYGNTWKIDVWDQSQTLSATQTIDATAAAATATPTATTATSSS